MECVTTSIWAPLKPRKNKGNSVKFREKGGRSAEIGPEHNVNMFMTEAKSLCL